MKNVTILNSISNENNKNDSHTQSNERLDVLLDYFFLLSYKNSLDFFVAA